VAVLMQSAQAIGRCMRSPHMAPCAALSLCRSLATGAALRSIALQLQKQMSEFSPTLLGSGATGLSSCSSGVPHK
jgi:hypothetical protein